MFHKKEKPAAPPESGSLPSHQDLIVHNMPNQAKLGGSFPSSAPAVDGGFGLPPVSQKHNFKAIGLVIIVLGIVFIGALAYLSYRFIISPTAGKSPTTAMPPVVDKQPDTVATITPAVVATPVPETAAVVVPIASPLEIATSTVAASSLMNEELSGQDGSNLPPLLDSDNDGLINEEEILLGISATSTDSDGDSYGDSAELAKGYNPAGEGKLADNLNLAEYNNGAFNYRFLYPKSWEIKSLAGDATTVFMAPDDSLIQISIQENSDKAGILSWYEDSFPDTSVAYDQLLNVDGWEGIMGSDNLNFYLTDSARQNIYVISYIPAVAGRLVYPNIFKLMINSLVIK